MPPDVPPGDPRRTPKAPPAPEYRPTREYETADTSMRNMALAAVGIAAVVMGGVFVLSRHHAAPPSVPVIEPDPTPLRVKPADPGGMKIAGADDAMPDDATGVEADKLAPPPETPAPQVLQQQARAGIMTAPPRIGAPVVAPQPPPPSDVAPPIPATPAPGPAVAPPILARPILARPIPAKPAPDKTGAVAVQLAALDSQQAAQAEWDRLSRKLPAALAGHRPDISRTDRDGKIFYRLRVGGFTDIAAATAFCARLHAADLSCTLAQF